MSPTPPSIYRVDLIEGQDIFLDFFFGKKKSSEHIGPHWAERVGRAPPGGVWVGVWFISRLYCPFGKGPVQHIIRCLKNKKCENELSCLHTCMRL